MRNNNLSAARRNKNDEFYTLLPDIENELKWYKDHFKDKVVYCNCDDPSRSNFVSFFKAKFETYGLKKLIATHYIQGALTTQKLELTKDETTLTTIDGDGSYSSDPCLLALEEADIVITNPPFSLFREFVSLLVQKQKQFLIIGNMNAVSYKEIFSLIKNNKLWLGVSPRNMAFRLPDNSKVQVNACWFTNLEHYKRNAQILLYKKYSQELYSNYDNYQAIEVSKVKEIPFDYQGLMGVPITFLEKYCPDQFEIIGSFNAGAHGEELGATKSEIIQNGQSKLWNGPILNKTPLYKRIIIKHKEVNNED